MFTYNKTRDFVRVSQAVSLILIGDFDTIDFIKLS